MMGLRGREREMVGADSLWKVVGAGAASDELEQSTNGDVSSEVDGPTPNRRRVLP